MGPPKLVAKTEIKISICPLFSFFLPTRAKIFLFIAKNPSGDCMVNSQWELLSQEIRDPENIPLPNLQLLLALISLVYLSLQWYLGNQYRSNTGQFPHCYQISEIFRPHQIPYGVDTFLTPSPGARRWAPARWAQGANVLLPLTRCCRESAS